MEQQNENNQTANENIEAVASVRAGTALREARERLGLTVADAAAQTKLAPRQIEALEADDYQHLPEMAFVRGFVRSYAKVLQLDVQPLLAALPQTHIATQMSLASVDVPFPDARSPQLQNLIWLGGALFLSVVVVAFAVWHYTSPTTSAESVQSQPVETAIPLPTQMQVIPASAVEEAFASSGASAVPAAQSTVPVAQPVVSAAQPAVPVAQPTPVAAIPSVKQPLAVSAVKPAPTAVKILPVSAVAAAKPAPVATKPLPVSAVAAAKSVVAPAKPLPVSAVVATKPAALAAKPLPASSVPAVKPVAPAVKPVTPAAKPTVATPAATAQPTSLRLTFGEESWTEVRDKNGNIVSSQLNPAGSELRLSGQGPYSLVVGRASSARLTYKGKTVDLKPTTSATSDVARLTLE